MSNEAAAGRRLAAWKIAAFAAPAAPLLALSLPSIIFLPPHFAEHLGLPLWAVSAIFLGARLFDLGIDPMIGNIQDRTESRWGRRRFWIAISCPFLMAFIWMIFIGFGPGTSAWVAGLAVFFMYIAYASTMISHLGWAGELQPSYHGRTNVLGSVQVSSMIGQSLMLILSGVAVQAFGGSNADAVVAMGVMLLVLLPVTTAAAVLTVPEPHVPPQPHLTVAETLRTLASNKLALRVLTPDLLLGVAQGVSGGLFLFYFQFALGFAREAQTLLAVYFLAGLFGVPLWWWLARGRGKHISLQAALIFTAATTALIPALPADDFWIAAPFMALAGISQGGGVLLTRALMADVVDEDELRTGARRSGLYFGVLLTTSKLGIAAGPITYAILGAVGFEPHLGAGNSALAMSTLAALFIGVPILLNLMAAWSLRNYPLDERRQAELAAALAQRRPSADAAP